MSKTMQEKTCLSHSLCFSSVRGQTQQTKDDNAVYLNTIQPQLEEEEEKQNKKNHTSFISLIIFLKKMYITEVVGQL